MSASRRWFRALAAGLAWFTTLFVVDTVDSYFLILRSTRHIKTDAKTMAFLRDGVLAYVAHVALAYLLMGLLAGVSLRLLLRLWFPEEPPARRWWRAALGLAAGATLLGSLRQASHFPTLYDSIRWTRPYAEVVQPWMVDVAEGLVAVAWLALAARRWRGRSGFGRRLAAAFAWALALLLVFRNPPPAKVHDGPGPNLVILGVDALRPDHLGFYGYDRDTSPHIDALLRESLVFDSAWTPLARTYPAWTATMSGTLPITNGVRDNLPDPDDLIPDVPLLPQVLAAAGWTTAFATDDSRFSYMVPEFGWQHILQPPVSPTNFAVSVNEPRYRAFHGLMHNPVGFALVPTARHNQAFGKSYRPELFADRAQDLLARVSEEDRFFYALHSCVLHAPGDRNWPWNRMFGQVGYEGRNRYRYSRSGTMLLAEGGGDEPDNRVAAQDARIYDSGVAMADRLVGQLVDALRASGRLDDTILVLFSDHGEELWAPDLPYRYAGPNHGFHPFGDGQHRVALAIRFPDGAHAGERVADPVRLVDLAPTLAELLGVDFPGETDGRSVMPLVRGEETGGPRPVYIETGLSEPRYWVKGHKRYPFHDVSERYRVDPETRRVYIRPEFRPHLIAAKDRVYQLGRWKLVWFAMRRGWKVALYDHLADPLNRHDLAAEHPEVVARLGVALAPYLRRDGLPVRPLEQWERVVAGEAEPSEALAGMASPVEVVPRTPSG